MCLFCSLTMVYFYRQKLLAINTRYFLSWAGAEIEAKKTWQRMLRALRKWETRKGRLLGISGLWIVLRVITWVYQGNNSKCIERHFHHCNNVQFDRRILPRNRKQCPQKTNKKGPICLEGTKMRICIQYCLFFWLPSATGPSGISLYMCTVNLHTTNHPVA